MADDKQPNPQDLVIDMNNDGVVEKTEIDVWKNRRRMAWIALAAMIGVTIGVFFIDDAAKLEQVATLLTWFYIGMSSIVGAYFGFATWADIKGK